MVRGRKRVPSMKAGSLDEKLLKAMLADPYFHRAAPKSTGQDHFNLAWLSALLTDSPAPEDVQRTLLEVCIYLRWGQTQ